MGETSIFSDDKEFEFEHVEQYMHACKALIFGDITVLDQILSTHDPKEAKKLGRQVANFNDAVWTEVARNIVTRGCWLKFSQNAELLKEMEDRRKRVCGVCSKR